MAYLLTKTAHLVFVIAWMATVFYLPRILVNIAEAGDDAGGARAAGADGPAAVPLRPHDVRHRGGVRAGAVAALRHQRAAGCTPSWCWSRCCWRTTSSPGAG